MRRPMRSSSALMDGALLIVGLGSSPSSLRGDSRARKVSSRPMTSVFFGLKSVLLARTRRAQRADRFQAHSD